MAINSPETAALVRAIHTASRRWVLACTGGGSRAIAELLEVPGASHSVLEAVVPYSSEALVEWLHGRPDQFCAPRTARAMSMAAYQRAVKLSAEQVAGQFVVPPLGGLGCTASLASDRPKRGAHRLHVAVQTADCTRTRSLELIANRRSRAEEEEVAARMILDLMAETLGLPGRLPLPLLVGERVEAIDTHAKPEWRQLLAGQADKVLHGKEPGVIASRRLVFPGAFNPLHEGHRAITQAAEQRLGDRVEWELSTENVDKPPLDFTEIAERCRQFSPDQTLWLTRCPRFTQKAAAFPNCTFLVGVDTIRRLAEERYYAGQTTLRDRALDELARRGARFLVFGRLEGNDFHTLADCPLPPALQSLCDEMPESEFRRDVSSTQLRGATPT